MTAQQLIKMSVRETRTVTEYPETQADFDAIVDGLRIECDDDCEGEEDSGAGHSGPEARGSITYWGDGWKVCVVRAAARCL